MTKKIQPTDLLAVNRANTNYSVPARSVGSKLRDDDYMVVLRGTTHYKVAGVDIKSDLTPAGVEPEPGDVTANPAFLSGNGTAGDPYVLTTAQVAPYGASWESVQELTIPGLFGELIVFDDQNVATNGERFVQPIGAVGPDGTWKGHIYYKDTPASSADQDFIGLLKIGNTYIQWTINQLEGLPPIATSFDLVRSGGGSIWTNATYDMNLTMSFDGLPASTKKIKGHATGTLLNQKQVGTVASTAATTANYSQIRENDSQDWYNGSLSTPVNGYPSYANPGSIGNRKTGFGSLFDGDYSGNLFLWYSDGLGNGNDSMSWCGLVNPAPPGTYYIDTTDNENGTHGRMDYRILYKTNNIWYVQGVGDPNNGSTTRREFTVSGNLEGLGLWIGGFVNTQNSYWRNVLNSALQPLGPATPVDTVTLTPGPDFSAGNLMGKRLVGETSGAYANVTAVNGNTLTVAILNGSFQTGESCYTLVQEAATTIYLELDSSANVTGLTPVDPGYTLWTPSSSVGGVIGGTLTFPATFESGLSPNDELKNSELSFSVEASNPKGTVEVSDTPFVPS